MADKDKIVVLLGAGAVAESTNVNTESLTKKVMEACETRDDCSHLLNLVMHDLDELYGHKGGTNFEDIFNIVELMYGYKTKNRAKGHVPQERAFLTLKRQYMEDVSFGNICAVQDIVLTTINETIYEYDTRFATQGAFYKEFFTKLEKESNSYLDVFNLNYDTWTEQSLSSWTDGYVESANPRYKDKMLEFDISQYLQNNINRISHLHGQIYFEFPSFDIDDEESRGIGFKEPFDTLYKYKSYDYAKYVREHVIRSGDATQSGNYIHKANIITGMMKLDKILWHPFNTYLGEFIHSLIMNKKLIVVGYGFFDLYINRLLEMFNNLLIYK